MLSFLKSTKLSGSICLLCLAPFTIAKGLVALDDVAMASVTGREGIAIDLELTINADSNGSPLSSLSDCAGVGNPCVLALQFANRTSGGGEWLVIKDYYGVLRVNDLQLDGSRLGATPAALQNPDRFLAQDGTTCLNGDCDPTGDLAALFTFPDTPGFNADVEWGLTIGRASVQFGPDAFLPSADNNASFVGVKIGDTQNGLAQIDFGGSVQLFGF